MLVESPRHTAADLAVWAQAERGDALHAALPRVAALAGRARAAIAEFAAAGPGGYVSTSWGKDSTAVAHLAHGAGLPLVHMRTTDPARRADPDGHLVRDAYLAAWPARYVEVWVPDPVADQLGLLPGIVPGLSRYVSGVRAEESATRAVSARVHGVATARACRPLLRWSLADVFAYLYVHRLPVHPAYAMTGGGAWSRADIRVHHLRTGRSVAPVSTWQRRYYRT